MSNQIWLERSRSAVWHPCTQMKWHEFFPLIPIKRAEGVWLHDYDGRRYLDGVSSWWVNLFGHRNPDIVSALQAQLTELDHVMLAGLTHRPVIELSERLSGLTGSRLGHCFYGSDGASATEVALKMSAHFWRNQGKPGKSEFIALAGSYHGETLGALGVTDVSLFRDAYGPMIRDCIIIPAPDSRLGTSSTGVALGALRKQLERYHEKIAAFIVEPLIQSAAGMIFHEPEFLLQAAKLCRDHGVHLIADEIAVGFGRTGSFFAHEQAGIVPDFLCLSKGITGGFLPLSVVLTSDEVYAAFYDDRLSRGFLHSHSYTGNALACRAALAVLDIFERDAVIESNRLRQTGFQRMTAFLEEMPGVMNFRHLGMVWAFDVNTGRPDFARQFHRIALEHELLLRPIGNTVYFMPPYSISDAEFRFMVDGVRQTLERVMQS